MDTAYRLYQLITWMKQTITFEPPFYKVKAGDFTAHSEANDFKFKLNQLGYPEARVIQETVNIFE